jgi:hypothetical protein
MLGDSAMKAGDWVEVRPLSEILATLDAHGCLDSMPFMPEMAGLCGTRFQIWKSAHKTCDPTGATDLRRQGGETDRRENRAIARTEKRLHHS